MALLTQPARICTIAQRPLLTPPLRVEKLLTALRAKAKEDPGFRFYSLYGKVYRQDILRTPMTARPENLIVVDHKGVVSVNPATSCLLLDEVQIRTERIRGEVLFHAARR